MGCGVCIGGDWDGDEYPEFQNDEIVKAKKPHKCGECGRPIILGSQYQRYTAKWDGTVSSYKTCLDCMNIRSGLVCEGGAWPAFGNLWSDIGEVFENMNTGCLMKVKTVSAKLYLLERWRKWKFKE